LSNQIATIKHFTAFHDHFVFQGFLFFSFHSFISLEDDCKERKRIQKNTFIIISIKDGMDESGNLEDPSLTYGRYDKYVDAHITDMDMKYLGDVTLARFLVEDGHRGKDMITRKEFEAKKRETLMLKDGDDGVLRLASDGYTGSSVFLQALAAREPAVRHGKLSVGGFCALKVGEFVSNSGCLLGQTVIYIRDMNASGQEVSGYIDFGHRLKTENFREYFEGSKRLFPTFDDLSYYNWKVCPPTTWVKKQCEGLTNAMENMIIVIDVVLFVVLWFYGLTDNENIVQFFFDFPGHCGQDQGTSFQTPKGQESVESRSKSSQSRRQHKQSFCGHRRIRTSGVL
jgi:hypothetical protein